MTDVFISYKREQRPLVFKINERLRDLKLDTWFDAELLSGTAFQDEITRRVRSSKSVVVCWSKAAIQSDWVRAEAEIGRERRVLCPIMVEDCELPIPYTLIHTQDLRSWDGSIADPEWQKFIEGLGIMVQRPTLGLFNKLLGGNDFDGLAKWSRENPGDPLCEVADQVVRRRNVARLEKEMAAAQHVIAEKIHAVDLLSTRPSGLEAKIAHVRAHAASPLFDRLFSDGPKRVLALDGKYSGASYTLGVLGVLEGELRRRSGSNSVVLADYFDLIGSSSLTSVIGVGLALGWDVETTASAFRKLLAATLNENWYYIPPFTKKYSQTRWAKAVHSVFGSTPLTSSAIKTGLIVLAQRVEDGLLYYLGNNPLSLGADIDPSTTLSDLVLASAAHPYFYPEVSIKLGGGGTGLFINPVLSQGADNSAHMFLAATVPEFKLCFARGAARLMLLSIGGGARELAVDSKQYRRKVALEKTLHSLGLASSFGSDRNMILLQTIGTSQKAWRVRSFVGPLEGSRLLPDAMLNFQRINVRFNNDREEEVSVARLKGRPLTKAELEAVANELVLAPSALDELHTLGRLSGMTYLGEAYPPPEFDVRNVQPRPGP